MKNYTVYVAMLDPSDEDVSQERSAVHESDFRRQCRMELDLHLSDFSDDDTEPPDIGIPLSVLEKAVSTSNNKG